MQHPNQEGTLAGGGNSLKEDDAQRDRTAPWETLSDKALGPSEYHVPTNTWESQCLFQANAVMTMSRSSIRKLVAAPLPQIGPRGIRHSEPLTVTDVLVDVARNYADNRTSFSGSPAGYSSAPRNQWGSTFG